MWRSLHSNQVILQGTKSSLVSIRNSCTAAAIALLATSQNNYHCSNPGGSNSSSSSSSDHVSHHDAQDHDHIRPVKPSLKAHFHWLVHPDVILNGWNIHRFGKKNKHYVSLCEPSPAAAPPPPPTVSSMGQQGSNPNTCTTTHMNVDATPRNQDMTFRQRRLSIHNTDILQLPKKKRKEPDNRPKRQKTEGTSHDSQLPTTTDNYRECMYASEMDPNEIFYQNKPKNGASSYQSRSQIQQRSDNATSTSSGKLFPPHQVGTYSCHGIEPHPIIVYEPVEYDTDITIFFRKMFGVEPSPGRSRARISTISKRKINQDRAHVCIYPDSSQPDGRGYCALFGTYDGHGERGELLAEYTMNAIYDKLYLHPSYSAIDGTLDIERAFQEVFCEIDEEIKHKKYLSSYNSGSTACVVLLQGNTLWVANVGDSRAVLATRCPSKTLEGDESESMDCLPVEAIDLSEDQNVHVAEERDRILNAGGFITVPDDSELPARVWLDDKCSKIGLAMSRSIGDHALKDVGVIAEPVVKNYVLNHNDEFFILATDGVWEFVSSTEAVAIVGKCFQQGMGASEACEELIKVAMSKWKEKEGDYRDDVSAIVVRLDGIWDHLELEQ